MKTQQDLPTILQEYQHKNKLNEHQMAKLLGVTQSCYNNWKNRKVQIGYKHYPIISQVCQIEVLNIIPSQATVKLSSTPTMENAESVNAYELYRTFTTPLFEMIEMLKKEIREKDMIIQRLQEERYLT